MSNRNMRVAVATLIVMVVMTVLVLVGMFIADYLSYKVAMTFCFCSQSLSALRLMHFTDTGKGFAAFVVSMMIMMLLPTSWVQYLGANALLFIPYTLERMHKEGSLLA